MFVNTRRLAERLARHLSERLGEDAVDRASRQPVEGAPARRRDAAEERRAEGAGRDRVARARHRHRPRRSRLPDRIAAPDRDAAAARRPIGPHGDRHAEGPRASRRPATTWSSASRCCARSARASSIASSSQDAPLDVLAQQIVAETSCREYTEDELFALVRRAWPYRALDRAAVRRGRRRCWPRGSRRSAAGAARWSTATRSSSGCAAGAARGCSRSPRAARSPKSPTTAWCSSRTTRSSAR